MSTREASLRRHVDRRSSVNACGSRPVHDGWTVPCMERYSRSTTRIHSRKVLSDRAKILSNPRWCCRQTDRVQAGPSCPHDLDEIHGREHEKKRHDTYDAEREMGDEACHGVLHDDEMSRWGASVGPQKPRWTVFQVACRLRRVRWRLTEVSAPPSRERR